MIPTYTIALPHTILLCSYLLLLLYSIYKDSTWGYYFVAALILLEATWNYYFGTGNNLMHSLIDLGIISVTAVIFFALKQRILKGAFLLSSIAGFFMWHINIVHTDSISHDSVGEDVEYFLEFDNVANVNEWMETSSSEYSSFYPLFSPIDKSFQLDEYVLVRVSADRQLDFENDFPEIQGLIHAEINDQVILEMPNNVVLRSSEGINQLNDPHVDKQWMADPYKMDKFHKLAQKHKIKANGGTSVVAILDTGVDASHEDLKDNYISIASRFDNDPRGHGTHCAGIAAAVTGNKIGIISLIPSGAPVKVTSVRVMNSFGIGSQRTIIDGIIRAADEGCSVISLSLGGVTSDSKEKAYAEAVRYANAKGSIVVVAAGNSGNNARGYTPANTKGVITVTATDTIMRKADFGNDVTELDMGLAAPGTAIYSTFPEDEYKSFNGTSMAAPFVSGLIGLMKAYDPSLSTQEVYTILSETAIRKDRLFIVDPYAALEKLFNTRLSS